MKECRRCKETLEVESFSKDTNSKDGLDRYCRKCKKSMNNPEKASKSRRRGREAAKIDIINALGGCCRICGLTPSDDWPVACFDFHHFEGKDNVLSKLLSSGGKKAKALSEQESEKCSVLCANCHRRHHYFRKATLGKWRTFHHL